MSHKVQLFLQKKVWFGVTALILLVAVGAILVTRPASNHGTKSLNSPSANEVISDIQKQQTQQDTVATDIHIIHFATVKSEGFAFASFNVGGSRKYASLLLSPSGYSMSTFSLGRGRSRPIQQIALRADGFEYITGKVASESSIKTVIIIFSNGTSVSVRGKKGYFWYEHKTPMHTAVHVKRVIGVTATGALIQNATS